MLLILHGELERVQQEKSDEFLKSLNVYQEVVNLKTRVDDNKFYLSEILPLHTEELGFQENKLQAFINKVVRYADYKQKIQEVESSTTTAPESQLQHVSYTS